MPRRGNIEFIEVLDRFGLKLDRFDTADPALLEVPYYFLDDLKLRSNIAPDPEDKDRLLQPIADRFPPLPGVDKSIRHSWHYAFLQDMEDKGNAFDPTQTDYFQYYKAQEELLGLNRHSRCVAKIDRLRSLYRKIQEEGFLYSNLLRFLIVIEQPLSVTQHGMPAFNSYFEIVSGHHRAAIAAFLGIKQVKVLVVRDKLTHIGDMERGRRNELWRDSR